MGMSALITHIICAYILTIFKVDCELVVPFWQEVFLRETILLTCRFSSMNKTSNEYAMES